MTLGWVWSCSARLQAGTMDASKCSPEGKRYRPGPMLPLRLFSLFTVRSGNPKPKRLKPVLLHRLHRNDKRIPLDQRLHLIVGEGKLHVEAVSRGDNLRAVEERAEVRVGVSDLIFTVHESGLE